MSVVERESRSSFTTTTPSAAPDSINAKAAASPGRLSGRSAPEATSHMTSTQFNP